MRLLPVIAAASLIALAACAGEPEISDSNTGDTAAGVEFPETLAAFGDGYPESGDPCRQLGESEATSNYLDDSALLVGCPSEDDANALGGTVIDTIEGITLVSIALGDANMTMGSPIDSTGDALVEGTEFNATTILPCGFDGEGATSQCDAGVVRNWGDNGEALVQVTKPDGSQRAIFFDGTTPIGADSAEADGSAGWDFDHSRDGDRMTITYGPETYVMVDAFIVGG